VLRRAAAAAYNLGSVHRSAGRLEHLLRIARRAARMPYPLAAVAQNTLDGIAYHCHPAIVEQVWGSLLDWNGSAAAGHSRSAELSSLDLGLTCSRMFAQKTRALFDASHLQIGHPFLTAEVVEFALQTMDSGMDDEPKGRLKQLLAREVPAARPHRAKSGFPLSVRGIFGSQSFLNVLTEIVAGRTPLAGMLRTGALSPMRDRLAAGKTLNWQTCNFLWTAVFTHLWLQQVRCGGERDPHRNSNTRATTELACTT
jgi:hypothetical protein